MNFGGLQKKSIRRGSFREGGPGGSGPLPPPPPPSPLDSLLIDIKMSMTFFSPLYEVLGFPKKGGGGPDPENWNISAASDGV